jgi:hypothetical protein
VCLDGDGVVHRKVFLANKRKCLAGLFPSDLTISLDNSAEIEQSLRAYYTSPIVDFGLIKVWMEQCARTHESCHRNLQPLQDRLTVIDCVERKVVQAPASCSYIALSYVWGDHQSSLDECLPMNLQAGISQTVEDSIKVNRMLGLRYLWVDRYVGCKTRKRDPANNPVYDQHNAPEKQKELNCMGQIFSSAQLTIVAAAGADPTYALPGVSRHRLSPGMYETVGRMSFVFHPEWVIITI